MAWREHLAQFRNDFGVGEPFRDLESLAEPPSELGAGEGLDLHFRRRFVHRHILRLVLDKDHLLERHERDIEFLLVLLEQFLGSVGPVVGLAAGFGPGAGMIAADDKVGASEILANDAMPKGLPRTGHPHGEVEQTEGGGLLGIRFEDAFVAAHPGKVVDVPLAGHPDDGVNEEVGFVLARRPEGQLLMGAMHRVARLERHHLPPAELAKAAPQLRRRVTEEFEIVMDGRLDALQATTHIDIVGMVQEVIDPRVLLQIGAENGLGLGQLVDRPDIADFHRRDDDALVVAQGDPTAAFEAFGKSFGHVEGDGNGPEQPGREAHFLEDAVVIVAIEEAFQRREGTVENQFEITELAIAQIPGRVALSLLFFLLGGGFAEVEFFQYAAMRFLECAHGISGLGCE